MWGQESWEISTVMQQRERWERGREQTPSQLPLCASLSHFTVNIKILLKKDDWGQVSCYDVICRLKFASHSKDVWDQYQSFAEVLYMYVTEKGESEFWSCY